MRTSLLLTIALMLISTLAIGQRTELFTIDRIHSKIGFSIGYAGGVIDAEGRFDRFSGNITLNPEAVSQISATITIQVNSIDTGMEFRDKDLRSPNWFDAEQFPAITFSSASSRTDGDKHLLIGDLSMHGVTQTVSIEFAPTTETVIQGPGRLYVGYEGSLTLNRQDFGIHTSDPDESFWKYNDVMASTGEMFVADMVKINLKILAVRSGREILSQAVEEKGIDAGYTYYKAQQAEIEAGKILFHERDLNSLGYQFLGEGKTEDAIKVFTLYVADYPESSNAYDSLAEAYTKAGSRDLAIENYEKSLSLNPNNINAREMLAKLQE